MKSWFFDFAEMLGILVLLALGVWIVQLLWNWLMPYLFQLPTITYWQALGISFLCDLLFGRKTFNSKEN